ncbi:MAG: hypothetical protein ACLUBL_08235 [Fusobacterium sp.]|uniref:hypothetical protein n=2 Tax=Fusobacterium sp. TaxID=68766 RepID=UPI003993DC54
MRMLKPSRMANEINMIIKMGDRENNPIYITKDMEEKALEFNVFTQILVNKEFNLILSLRKEENGKIYKNLIERFILNKNGFQISNEEDNSKFMKNKVQTSYKSITYQLNNELNIKLNFLLQEGLYELTFSIENEEEEKVLSLCPFEVRKQ